MEITRRNALKASTVVPVAIGVGGMSQGALFTCGANGIQIDPNVLVSINNLVVTGCNFIPAITTVIALVNVAFPSIIGATTVTEAVMQQIAQKLCAAAPASNKLGAEPTKVEGTDITVHGWVVGPDGKLVYV